MCSAETLTNIFACRRADQRVSERTSIRNLAVAFGVGAVAALVFDVVLQNALDAVRSPGQSSMTPWWIVGHAVERSTWIVLALLLWLLAPALSTHVSRLWPASHVVTRAAAFDFVARSMAGVPLVWLLATWLVYAARLTFTGAWGSEGRVFTSAHFYYNVLLAYAPWLCGAITLFGSRRHVADD
jgi:hypothetical protein